MLSVEFFVRELPKSTAKNKKIKRVPGCTFQFYFFLHSYETVPGSDLPKNRIRVSTYVPSCVRAWSVLTLILLSRRMNFEFEIPKSRSHDSGMQNTRHEHLLRHVKSRWKSRQTSVRSRLLTNVC
jgi:hypothetical protein